MIGQNKGCPIVLDLDTQAGYEQKGRSSAVVDRF